MKKLLVTVSLLLLACGHESAYTGPYYDHPVVRTEFRSFPKMQPGHMTTSWEEHNFVYIDNSLTSTIQIDFLDCGLYEYHGFKVSPVSTFGPIDLGKMRVNCNIVSWHKLN